MLTNTKLCKTILLFLTAFLTIPGCKKIENEISPSLMMTNNPSPSLIKSGVVTSTTGFPMIDLGALGNPRIECTYGVNNSGKVVGQAFSPSHPYAFLWSRQYGFKDLGTLGTPENSWANDINDCGQVVGCSWVPPTTLQRAFLWRDNGGMVNLGTFGDFLENSFSMGFGINNRGEIVGVSDNLAFLWTKGHGMVRLGTLSKDEKWKGGGARDINDNGQIVGMSQLPAPESNPEVPWTWKPDQYHAVLWTGVEKILDLGTLKLNSQALGINNRREIVGGSSDKEGWTHERIGSYHNENGLLCFDPSCVAFIWTERHGMTQLPILAGGNASSAYAINDIGQVVGWSYTAANEVHAFVWTSKKGTIDLGTLPGDHKYESVAYSINNPGQVAGYSFAEDGSKHAVIWTIK